MPSKSAHIAACYLVPPPLLLPSRERVYICGMPALIKQHNIINLTFSLFGLLFENVVSALGCAHDSFKANLKVTKKNKNNNK